MTTNSRARILRSRPTGVEARRTARPGKAADKPGKSDGPPVSSLGEAESIVVDMMQGMRPVLDMFRDGPHLHVSDVIHKCLRQIALVKRLDIRAAGKRLRDSEVLTFRQGDAIHDFVRQRFIDNHPAVVFGRWACPCKKTTTAPMLRSQLSGKHECPSCGQMPFSYVEVGLPDEEYGLIGSPDLLLYLAPHRAYHVTEIKSISGKGFAELARAIPEHIIQVVFYWHLMRRAGRPVTDKVSILYVNKEYSFKNPYREFLLDAAENEKRIMPLIEDLMTLNRYVAGEEGAELPYRACGTLDAPGAKDCPVRVSCFQ